MISEIPIEGTNENIGSTNLKVSWSLFISGASFSS